MLLEQKHFHVNWMDGMKISKDHFYIQENAFIDSLRDISAINLNNFNYGLLPPLPGEKQSFEVWLNYDQSQNLTVKILKCRAITPGGIRIEISPIITQQVQVPDALLKGQYSTGTGENPMFDIVIVVDPFNRFPVGSPDPQETPPRHPFTLPSYKIEIVPHPQLSRPENAAFQFTIARIELHESQPRIVDSYVPPCTAIHSHPFLVGLYQKYLAMLSGIEVEALQVIQKIKAKMHKKTLDFNLLALAEHSTFFIANSLDYYRLIVPYSPPIFTVQFFARFARVLQAFFHSISEKERESLLNYIGGWLGQNPGIYENDIRDLISLEYQHSEISPVFEKVGKFVSMTSLLFKKLYELNYLGERKVEEEIFGWVVIHDPKKEPIAYKLNKKSVHIGRMMEGADVEIKISGDNFISRRHARLEITEIGGNLSYHLVDLKSRNGTFIHGPQEKLSPNQRIEILEESIFQIGQTNMVLITRINTDNEQDALYNAAKVPYLVPFEIKE